MKSKTAEGTWFTRFLGSIVRGILVDAPLALLFSAFLAFVLLHKVNDDYLYKQIVLMRFQYDSRHYRETTYYHRYCDGSDVSATSVDQLLIPDNATAKECAEHMLIHGASMYPNLLSPETAHSLREYIVQENKVREGYDVIENEYRYSWGIDVNEHPALKQYWKELVSNKVLVDALQEIMGSDPAVIEFTAITSAYGAVDQYDHPDVVSEASGAKYAHSFVPSYSLFIPLQDTSYDMGATHICPGTHLCGEGATDNCPEYNLAMSGPNDNWPTGWGALVNQQTIHKGMGHSKEGGLDRVVIIATFAPRPQTNRGLETRMIGQGGSYSMLWSQWGHTFSDFVNAEQRMNEPQKTMRAFGLIKGSGWNLVSVASMRIANDDTGYRDEDGPEIFMSKGGFEFLPLEWQGAIDGDDTGILENEWYSFLVGTVKRSEERLKQLNILALSTYLAAMLVADILLTLMRRARGSMFLRGLRRVVVTHGLVAMLAFALLRSVQDTNWAKDIASGKSMRLPEFPEDHYGEFGYEAQGTFPTRVDILVAPHYNTDHLASYGKVVEFAHPGNAYWNQLMDEYSTSYPYLSENLKKGLCRDLLGHTRQLSRFLGQGEQREWVEINDEESLLTLCNEGLHRSANPVLDAMVHTLNGLNTLTKLGRFRHTSMQEKITPLLLEDLKHRLVPSLTLLPSTSISPAPRRLILGRFPLNSPSTVAPFERSLSHPTYSSPHEPYPLLWAKEGDLVEAKFRCEFKEWYPGVLTLVNANDRTFEVRYLDGDMDHGMDFSCLRPFKPYEVDEELEVRDQEGRWHVGLVVDSYIDDIGVTRFVVQTNDIHLTVDDASLRRFDFVEPYFEGEVVWGRYRGEDEWFEGTIEQVNAGGTYTIRYSDGDIEYGVPDHFIQRG
eukprot:Nitzschia sp. Nitz4//scaffold35_size145790//137213//140048//NITZ4_003060-RA/size145790-augustus-gene-0.127-mRNA-1//1//CDS//3329549214//7659//frame0